MRIDVRLTLGVVPLDVIEPRRVPERRHGPVQPAHPAVQRRVPRADVAHVELEVLHVDGVEADDCREQADVRLGDAGAEEEGTGAVHVSQVRFGAAQGGEDVKGCALVRLLLSVPGPGLVEGVCK